MQLKPSDSYQQVQVRSFLGGFFVKHGQISLVSRKLTLFFRKWKNWHFIGNPRVRLAFFTTSILPRSAWGATLISPEVDTSMLLAHPILTVLATGENWRAMGCLSGRIAASEGDKQILASLLNDTLRIFFSKSHINRICLQKKFVSGSDLRVMAWRKRKKKPMVLHNCTGVCLHAAVQHATGKWKSSLEQERFRETGQCTVHWWFSLPAATSASACDNAYNHKTGFASNKRLPVENHGIPWFCATAGENLHRNKVQRNGAMHR